MPQNKNLKSRNMALLLFLAVFVVIFYGMGFLRIKGVA